MGLRELAEGIILQSIEDLSDQNLREDCITFFKGADFITCAELARGRSSETAQHSEMHNRAPAKKLRGGPPGIQEIPKETAATAVGSITLPLGLRQPGERYPEDKLCAGLYL
jgi:hypothetical protein